MTVLACLDLFVPEHSVHLKTMNVNTNNKHIYIYVFVYIRIYCFVSTDIPMILSVCSNSAMYSLPAYSTLKSSPLINSSFSSLVIAQCDKLLIWASHCVVSLVYANRLSFWTSETLILVLVFAVWRSMAVSICPPPCSPLTNLQFISLRLPKITYLAFCVHPKSSYALCVYKIVSKFSTHSN